MGGEVSTVPADAAACAARGAWSAAQAEEFIHLLELRAVIQMLRAFQTHLQTRVVCFLCDNTVDVAAIREGFSRSAEMRAVLCTLQLLLLQANSTLIP